MIHHAYFLQVHGRQGSLESTVDIMRPSSSTPFAQQCTFTLFRFNARLQNISFMDKYW